MAKGPNATGKKRVWGDGPSHFALHHNVARSPAYRRVSHTARSLLADVGLQYNGSNNGQLVAADRYLRPLGWRSANTVTWALRELLAAGLLVETRKGGINSPSWFALAWQPLDRNPGMCVDPATYERVHRGAYYRPDPAPVRPSHKRKPKDDAPTPPGGVCSGAIAPPGGVERAILSPPGGAMRPGLPSSTTPPGGA